MKKTYPLIALCCMALTVFAAEFADITIDELKSAIKSQKVVLLDANGSESWQKGHIPGAIDFSANKAKLADLLPKDKDGLVVAYCGGPKCKAYQEAAKAAVDLGYTNVKHLSAGISGWSKAGEPMEKGN